MLRQHGIKRLAAVRPEALGHAKHVGGAIWRDRRAVRLAQLCQSADALEIDTSGRDGSAQPIVWPPESKTGTLIYPYQDAKKK